jgi:dienelactone hydrolase
VKRALLLLLVLVAGGGWLIAGAGHDLRRAHVTSAGVPLEVVQPSGGGPHPGVVVAHGFAGSGKLMAPFGDTLAARGYAVVLLDFAGHGASTEPLPDQIAGTSDSTKALQRGLDVAVAHLRSLPGVDPSRVALVGHSMGAGAVTRYAAAHPDVTATVAISLPDGAVASAERPARLLTVVGALEFAGFRSAATSVAAARDDRAVRVVPGVEHITVLYAPETHRATVAWLDSAFGGPRGDEAVPFPGRRLIGAALLVLAFVLGCYPVAALLPDSANHPWPRFRRRTASPGRETAGPAGSTMAGRATAGSAPAGITTTGPGAPGPAPVDSAPVDSATAGATAGGVARAGTTAAGPVRGRIAVTARIVVVTAVAAVIAAVAARLLPTTRLPLAVAGYVTGYAAVTGALLLAYATWRPAKPTRDAAPRRSRPRLLLAVGYAVVAIAVPVHLGLTHALPVGDRWWLLPIVWAAFALLAYAAERATGGDTLGVTAVAAVFVAVLTAAAVTGLTHGFVLLVLFPLVGLLLWQALWSAFLNRFAVPAWLIALTGSVVVAWPLAVALPLAG